MSTRTQQANNEQAPWWKEIGGQSNHFMANKAFWMRSAEHYRDPFWRDVKAEMRALRGIKHANKLLKKYCITL